MTELQVLKEAKKIILEHCPGEKNIVSQLERLAAEKSKPGLYKMKKANEKLKKFKMFQS